VAAVIFTHTHTDHWGGARGVLDDEALAGGKVPIIAPNLFMEHAVSENIIAGLRGACHRARIRATRWLAMTVFMPPPHTTGTRLAATAAGEMTSISIGTRQRSVKRTCGSVLLGVTPSMTNPSKPLLMTSLHFCT
jgi:alkyl sulfatase BDS1-like metallo-beta-lactamase superfamily hydrolase